MKKSQKPQPRTQTSSCYPSYRRRLGTEGEFSRQAWQVTSPSWRSPIRNLGKWFWWPSHHWLWNFLVHSKHKQTRGKFQILTQNHRWPPLENTRWPSAKVRNLVYNLGGLVTASKCHRAPFSCNFWTIHKIREISTLLSSRVPKERDTCYVTKSFIRLQSS